MHGALSQPTISVSGVFCESRAMLLSEDLVTLRDQDKRYCFADERVIWVMPAVGDQVDSCHS